MWLEVEGLSVKTDELIIFEEANLSCDERIMIIRGQNGIGKSTFLNAVFKSINYEGSIKIFGAEINGISKANITADVSYICQQPKLFMDSAIKGNLKLLNINEELFNHYLKRFKVKENIFKKKLKHLSGGELQVVNICLGLAKESKLLLIDEPYNNLSKINKSIFEEIIMNSNRKVIIVSHEKSTEIDARVVEVINRGFNG